MATSVLLACGLTESLPSLTLIREECYVDASFLITCILGHHTKKLTAGTVLVCMHHRFQHYVGAGVRLGFNLQAARDRGTLRVIDLMAEATQNTAPTDVMSVLWKRIQEEVDVVRQVQQKPVSIILDDVTTLLDLGAAEGSVLQLCRQLCRMETRDNTPALSLVVKISACNMYRALVRNLSALTDTDLSCVRLQSGQFREVDGRLQVKRRDNASHNLTEKAMLYKVGERNIKIFALGEVGLGG